MHNNQFSQNYMTQEQKTPLVSFIIPAYNLSSSLVQECVESIMALSLSREDREVIVVDDGSDVPIMDGLEEYLDSIVYVRQLNGGLSVARNMGLRIATGDYIQFVDGDDKILRTAYEHCLDIARYHAPDMVLFESGRMEDADVPFSYEGPVSGSEYMAHNNLKSPVWGYLFRKHILGDLRFTPGSLKEDEEFTPLLMLRCSKVFVTNAKAYYYRRREGSITNNKDKWHVAKRMEDAETVLYKLQAKAAVLPIAERIALNRRVAQLTMDYLYQIIKSTHSSRHLEEAIERLRRHGLFPLPDNKYTKKYTTFRWLVSSHIGRKILLASSSMM